jgi:hypothetical protein
VWVGGWVSRTWAAEAAARQDPARQLSTHGPSAAGAIPPTTSHCRACAATDHSQGQAEGRGARVRAAQAR